MDATAGKETIELQVISNTDEILKLESAWNALVSKSCQNPFLLSSFVWQFIKSNDSTGWTPLILVFSSKNKIVGIAPLMTKKRLGVRSIKFVNTSDYSPDLILDDEYREICIAQTFEFLFKTLNSKFASFYVPVESPNFQLLKRQCKTNRIGFRVFSEMGHRVLPVRSSWSEFEAARGKNFRQQFRKAEKKLDRAGLWKIVRNGEDEGADAIEKIFDVERMSWKETWRTQEGNKKDEELIKIIEASQHTTLNEPNFNWNVWFLELNNQTLAYLLVLQYENVAYLTKTSYDERYRELYPGQYLRMATIRELLNAKQVKSIDFLTDLPHQRIWTSLCQPRARITMTKGILPTLAQSTFESGFLLKNQKTLLNKYLLI